MAEVIMATMLHTATMNIIMLNTLQLLQWVALESLILVVMKDISVIMLEMAKMNIMLLRRSEYFWTICKKQHVENHTAF